MADFWSPGEWHSRCRWALRVLRSRKGSCLGPVGVCMEELLTPALEALLPGLPGETTGRTQLQGNTKPQTPAASCRKDCLWGGECGLLSTSTWEDLWGGFGGLVRLRILELLLLSSWTSLCSFYDRGKSCGFMLIKPHPALKDFIVVLFLLLFMFFFFF